MCINLNMKPKDRIEFWFIKNGVLIFFRGCDWNLTKYVINVSKSLLVQQPLSPITTHLTNILLCILNHMSLKLSQHPPSLLNVLISLAPLSHPWWRLWVGSVRWDAGCSTPAELSWHGTAGVLLCVHQAQGSRCPSSTQQCRVGRAWDRPANTEQEWKVKCIENEMGKHFTVR